MRILSFLLLALFITLPAWLTGQLVKWAGARSTNKFPAALACVIIGTGEGALGYALFNGIPSGPSYWTGEAYVHEIYRMPIAGVGAMVMGGIVSIFGPIACLGVSGQGENP